MTNNNEQNSGIVLVSEIYPDNISVVPLDNRPIFPGLTLPLFFSSKELVDRINHAVENENGFIGVSFIKEPVKKSVTELELYKTGTLLKILRILDSTGDTMNILAQAVIRFRM